MSRILVVDDDKPIREVVQTILEALGHEVVTAANGKEALDQLQAGGVEAMVTDIFMPEMEGLEAIQQARKRFPGLKMIAMSGGVPRGPAMDYLGMARAFGAKRVLAKPFTAAELTAALKEAGVG